MRCAVLGDPIAHSLSPVLHRAAYDVLGLDWTYDAVRVPSGGLADLLGGLDRDTWRGLSLTMPLKREVLGLVEERTAAVALTGAANTVVLDGDRTRLDNTDLPGAVAAVRERWDGEVSVVTVLGAGATAASTGLALCELGAREVRLLARSPQRAAETVAAIAAHASAPTVTVGAIDDASVRGEVVVSTVPAAVQTEGLVRRCEAVPVVFEVLYDPWPTPLAAAASHDGRVLVTGLDLLVHQAVLQVGLFTGHPGPLDAMRAAGQAALRARAAGPSDG
ncbi:shikimate dehydrogenase [Nocardioides rubriscoriae]|uniref:shikimate dehydrogenase n=1 Tax=Nocardioides rubriscoriae TaxID=642762 RepID=UPI0011DFB540|nr:shikimate dehydrogenase [Nocardioides rubriscoriae]